MAENIQCTAKREYSNYTTSSGPDGESPCQTFSLTIGDIDKATDEPCSSISTAWYNFDVSPKAPGYHMVSFVDNNGPNKLDNDVSLTATDGRVKLTVQIDATERGDQKDKIDFYLQAYIQVIRVLEYVLNKTGGWDAKLETKSSKKIEEGKSNGS